MDLSRDPRWRPVRASFLAAGWVVRLWQEPRLPDEAGQDPYLVQLSAGRLRLAVADPAETCPDVTAQQAAWAGQVAVGALAANPRLTGGFADAARRLCDPVRRPRLANPTAALAAVDLDVHTGDVHAVRAGDCEVWVRTGVWRPLLSGPARTAAGEARLAAHPGGGLAGVDAGAHWRAHVEAVDDPQWWATTPLGMLPRPTLQEAVASGVEEVLVADDGPRLTAARCADLGGWLSGGLQRCGPDHAHPSPHGAVTVLHARRR